MNPEIVRQSMTNFDETEQNPAGIPAPTARALRCAWTYYENRSRLIYSYHGDTFLSGAPLFDADFDGRGNIDCSTFVHLVLRGIPYEKSPYATGRTNGFSVPTELRRANGLARKLWGEGRAVGDADPILPGDLVFYAAPPASRIKYLERACFLGISHVAVASENPSFVLQVTGTSSKEADQEAGREAVRFTPASDMRIPILVCRPDYASSFLLAERPFREAPDILRDARGRSL